MQPHLHIGLCGVREEMSSSKMDDTDRKLLMLIVTNPRISYHELSKSLGITKQAAFRRLHALKESGVIEGMTADISVSYLGAITVSVSGISNEPSVLKVFDRLGECEFTRRVIAGCGNYMFINGILRDLSELDEFVGFVKRAAKLRNVLIGTYAPDSGLMPNYVVDGIANREPSYKKLTNLDLRIIMSLKEDVRKPANDIAQELGVSVKTVRKHLDDMISGGALDLHVRTDSPLAGDLMFVVHVTLREGADRAAVCRRLMSKYPFEDAFFVAYDNLPNLLGWIFWTGEMSHMRRIVTAVDEDEDVVALTPNLGYLMRIYSTWQDKLPQQLIQASEGTGTKSRRPALPKR
jgi:DNA-binding Lrp family transcriptional regulator